MFDNMEQNSTLSPFLHYVQSQQLDIHYVSQLVKENKQEQMHDGKLPTQTQYSWNFEKLFSKNQMQNC